MAQQRRRIAIVGAAGRDFHNFNVVFRDDPSTEVVAFTAAQIPGIAGRRYPPALAGPLYPNGIPILAERELDRLCREAAVAEVVFAYSDMPHAAVMHVASRALAAGADFALLGPRRTALAARVPVLAVCAVRTGCGKSGVARWLARHLRDGGHRVAVVRHPMPYGDLERERVQRFATPEDLAIQRCTAEEREEYEPHLAAGNLVFAGVDYAAILAAAEAEADAIVWDGGNNDYPFYRPDHLIVLADALRPGQTDTHHPGEMVLRAADTVLIAKTDAATPGQIAEARAAVRRVNPTAPMIDAASPPRLEDPGAVRGRRVLVVEDGPTTTHGGMPTGAGYRAAVAAGAEIVDPRPWATAPIAAAYAEYPHIGPVLPALGYSEAQLAALAETIRRTPADMVVLGTPIDLARLVQLGKPAVRARYEHDERKAAALEPIVDAALAAALARRRPPSGRQPPRRPDW